MHPARERLAYVTVAAGTGTGPPIGMQKGSLFERRCRLVQVANRRDPRVTWSAVLPEAVGLYADTLALLR